MQTTKSFARALRLRGDEYVDLWTIALCTLATVYLLATFTID